MAISKERLRELINEGATIWSKTFTEEVYLNSRCFLIPITETNEIGKEEITNYILSVYEDETHTNKYLITELDEDVKKCKWSLKYHATRTEELNLPTWEEIEKIKEKDVYIIAKPKEMRFYIDYKFLIPQIKLCTLEDVFYWNLDEEGYLSACDLCIKLFKGEATE